ncbi:DUF397 domain-containing protein [Nonomuraea guangzhouensis]|uniref:DUF397 domain-containing protein n=1 Tax=Nonomuraea guangzhouensis TaxID=1291555 RepID=A0ABW4GIM1_9ACTN
MKAPTSQVFVGRGRLGAHSPGGKETSMSGGSDATGVDVDLSQVEWCKSTFSNNGGACAEFGKIFVPEEAGLHKHGDLVVVRDSKDARSMPYGARTTARTSPPCPSSYSGTREESTSPHANSEICSANSRAIDHLTWTGAVPASASTGDTTVRTTAEARLTRHMSHG